MQTIGRDGPRSDGGLHGQVAIDGMGAVTDARQLGVDTVEQLPPSSGSLGQDEQARADVLGPLRVVRAAGDQRCRLVLGTPLEIGVELVRVDPEAVRTPTDLTQRG